MPRTLFASSWPFTRMVHGQSVELEALTEAEVRRARNAAAVAGHRKGLVFEFTVTKRFEQDAYDARVRCYSRAVADHESRPDRRRQAPVNSMAIPDALKPGAHMPMRYSGGYPFQALQVGETFVATPSEMSMEALHRMASYAAAWRHDARRFTVSTKRHLGLPSKVSITRVE